MYDDIEADFWKEHFSHILHKNMVRIDARRLSFDNCAGVIDAFRNRHPELNPDINFYSGYATFEIFITPAVKLRLYIQNQVKGSLMQFDGGDYVKLVDARFPYDPFPEIEEFLAHTEEYRKELDLSLKKNLLTKKQLQVASQFIKAQLMKKFETVPETVWSLQQHKTGFTLSVQTGVKGEVKTFELSPSDFIEEIKKITV